MKVTILGKGNMGQAIDKNFELVGNQVEYFGNGDKAENLGDLVIIAVPFFALESIASQYKDELKGKIVIDISNPLNFDTWDELVVPVDSSAAQLLQSWLLESKAVKGFNTTFAATLQSGKIGDLPTNHGSSGR